jgi:F0F1-type ATP synthase assembly protein I
VATEDSGPPRISNPRKRPGEGARQLADILELPILLVATIAIGGGVGYFLDAKFHTSPVLTLVLGLVGFAAGMIQLVRRLSKDTDGHGGS